MVTKELTGICADVKYELCSQNLKAYLAKRGISARHCLSAYQHSPPALALICTRYPWSVDGSKYHSESISFAVLAVTKLIIKPLDGLVQLIMPSPYSVSNMLRPEGNSPLCGHFRVDLRRPRSFWSCHYYTRAT